MKEMSIELFNSFIYGNLISAAAMTRTLMEKYIQIFSIYVRLFMGRM